MTHSLARFFAVLAVICLVAFSASAQAQVLVGEYKFDSGATTNSATSTLATAAAGSLSAALQTTPTLDSGVLNSGNDWSPSSNGGGDYVYGTAPDLARDEAGSLGNYFQFTITPMPQIDFTSLDLWARRNNGTVGSSTFFLRSDLDLYGTTLAISTAADYSTNPASPVANNPSVTFNLSSISNL